MTYKTRTETVRVCDMCSATLTGAFIHVYTYQTQNHKVNSKARTHHYCPSHIDALPLSDLLVAVGLTTGSAVITIREAGWDDPELRVKKMQARVEKIQADNGDILPIGARVVYTANYRRGLTGRIGTVEKVYKNFKGCGEAAYLVSFRLDTGYNDYICYRRELGRLAVETHGSNPDARN